MIKSGNKPPGSLPSKMKFMLSDITRHNEVYDYNLDLPKNFFKASFKTPFCQQVIAAAESLSYSNEDVVKLLESFTDTILVQKSFRDAENNLSIGKTRSVEDVEFQDIVRYVLKMSNIDDSEGDKLVSKARSEEMVNKIDENTKWSIERGAFGVPTFIISDVENGLKEELFFGSDRFEQIASLFKKPYYGVNLQLSTDSNK